MPKPPAIPDNPFAHSTVSVHMPAGLHAAIQEVADEAGVAKAEWCRDALRDAAARAKGVTPEALAYDETAIERVAAAEGLSADAWKARVLADALASAARKGGKGKPPPAPPQGRQRKSEPPPASPRPKGAHESGTHQLGLVQGTHPRRKASGSGSGHS